MKFIKKYIIPFFLTFVFIGLGIYFLDQKTEAIDNISYKVKLIIEPKPDSENIKYYFQQEDVIELGKVDMYIDSNKSEEYYAFLFSRSGEYTLNLIPEDFNLLNLNQKTFMTVQKGSLINDTGETPYVRNTMEMFIKETSLQSYGVSVNNSNIIITGVAKEVPYEFVKINEIEENNKVHFFMDNQNKFTIDLSNLKGQNLEITKGLLLNY